MTHLAKLTFKTVDRSMKRDPIIARRDKLVAGLKEQKLVHAAASILSYNTLKCVHTNNVSPNS